jgi:hypothetical protein
VLWLMRQAKRDSSGMRGFGPALLGPLNWVRLRSRAFAGSTGTDASGSYSGRPSLLSLATTTPLPTPTKRPRTLF